MTEVASPVGRPAGDPTAADAGSSEQTNDGEQAAREKAAEVAGQAQDKVQEAAGQAKGKVREQVDQRSAQAGEQLATTAGDIRAVSEELSNQGKDGPAKLAAQAAERVERLGGYMKDSDADRILGDIEDFGRRQPWAVVAGGLAAGFAASRFLKASSSDRYRSSTGSGVHTGPTEGHPAGPGTRSDRDIGGPTAAPSPGGDVTGGAPGTKPGSGFAPHS